MRRRDLIALFGGVAIAWPDAARGQLSVMPVIGFLSSFSRQPNPLGSGPLARGLGETGYVHGRNVTIEYRWAESNYDRLPALAADLVSHKVDVIVTNGGTPPALAAKSATSLIDAPNFVITELDPVIRTSGPICLGLHLANRTVKPRAGVNRVAYAVRSWRNSTGLSPDEVSTCPRGDQ